MSLPPNTLVGKNNRIGDKDVSLRDTLSKSPPAETDADDNDNGKISC